MNYLDIWKFFRHSQQNEPYLSFEDTSLANFSNPPISTQFSLLFIFAPKPIKFIPMFQSRKISIIPFIFAILLQISKATVSYDEALVVYPLQTNVSPKVLLDYTFNFTHNYDPDSPIVDSPVLPRSVLDMLFVHSNNTQARIELANSEVNPFFLSGGHFPIDLPLTGKAIYVDEYTNWERFLLIISDIMSLSWGKIAHQQHFHQELGNKKLIKDQKRSAMDLLYDFPKYEDRYIYSSDAQDFFCKELVERFQTFLPCGSKSGLYKTISDIETFRAMYVGITFLVKYDRANKLVLFSLRINLVKDASKLNFHQFTPACRFYNTSRVIVLNGTKELQFDQKLGDKPLKGVNYSHAGIQPLISLSDSRYKTDMIKSQRYLTRPFFRFEDSLVHEISNLNKNDDMEVIVGEYFLGYTYPVFNKIEVMLNGPNQTLQAYNFTITNFENHDVMLNFKLTIPRDSEVRIVIPFRKTLKRFQNYPNDPSRGEDFLPVPVYYRFTRSTEVFKEYSRNVVVFIPHPDFSMPFVVTTLVMGAYAFLFLSAFNAVFYKYHKVSVDVVRRGLLGKILDKVRGKFGRGGKKVKDE